MTAACCSRRRAAADDAKQRQEWGRQRRRACHSAAGALTRVASEEWTRVGELESRRVGVWAEKGLHVQRPPAEVLCLRLACQRSRSAGQLTDQLLCSEPLLLPSASDRCSAPVHDG